MTEQSFSVIDRLRIFQVRGQAVLLDSDLAGLYGVSTKRLLEQVRRNPERFPPEYCFQLAAQELAALRPQIATSNAGRGGRRYRPMAFSEHGTLMAATVLNSHQAVAMSHYVIRAFLGMRREMQTNANLEARLAHIERTLLTHDAGLRDILEKIRPLLLPPPDPPKRRIGFRTEPE